MPKFFRALGPLIARVDGGARAAPPPTPAEDGTQFPRAQWDLRTLIAVFGPDAPLRFLSLTTTLGLTGLPFDQGQSWSGAPDAAFDVQLCLEGRGKTAGYKRYHRVGSELESTAGAVHLHLGERLRIDGAWPHYRIEWRQAEEELSLDIAIETHGDVQRWAWAPRYFCHYTSFGDCQLSWRWRGDSGELSTPALLDHGWGRRAPLASALGLFRYEVLRLPGDDLAIGLWTEGPAGLRLRDVGVMHRGGNTLQTGYSCRVEELDRFANYADESRHVPRRWRAELSGPDGTLRYSATRASAPQPVLGDGFVCAFDYEAEGTGAWSGRFSGEGYVEQLGPAWSANRRAPRGTSS
jgi:hypothetical protein